MLWLHIQAPHLTCWNVDTFDSLSVWQDCCGVPFCFKCSSQFLRVGPAPWVAWIQWFTMSTIKPLHEWGTSTVSVVQMGYCLISTACSSFINHVPYWQTLPNRKQMKQAKTTTIGRLTFIHSNILLGLLAFQNCQCLPSSYMFLTLTPYFSVLAPMKDKNLWPQAKNTFFVVVLSRV